jgi:hypothetical protein
VQIPRFDKPARELAAEQLNRLIFEDRVKEIIRIHLAKFEAQQQTVSIGELSFEGHFVRGAGCDENSAVRRIRPTECLIC